MGWFSKSHSLNQIPIWITAIYTPQLAHRARSINYFAAFENLEPCQSNLQSLRTKTRAHLYPSRLPSPQHIIDRVLGDDTEISGSRLDSLGFWLEFLTGEMEVDLLGAEFEGMAG